MPLIAAYSAWWLTFIAGVFILGPATDDGYYIEFSINSMNGLGPGFWLGEAFSSVFFVFPSFAWFYGKALGLVDVLSGGLGPIAFRLPQLFILLIFPFVLHRWLQFLKVVHPDYVLLTLTAFVATSYFFQQAITVRPELLGLLLLLITWMLLPKIEQAGRYFYCLLFGLLVGCGMILHPIFTFLNGVLLGSLILRQLRTGKLQIRQKIFNLGFVLCGMFFPVSLFLLHMYRNHLDATEQLFQRTSEVAPNAFKIMPKLWDDLFQVNASDSIFYYFYAAYPTMILVGLTAITAFTIVRSGPKLWKHSSHWPFLPLILCTIILFCVLQPYPPYLLVYNFFFATLVAVYGIDMVFLVKKRFGNIIFSLLFLSSFAFISIHLAKSHVGDESKYLRPVTLYDAVFPELEGNEASLFTTTARILPPLIGFYQNKDGGSRIKTFAFSPQGLNNSQKQRGVSFLENVSKVKPTPPILFAAAKKHVVLQSDHKLWLNVQDLNLDAHIVYDGIIYQDHTNVIVRVKSMCVSGTGEKTCR